LRVSEVKHVSLRKNRINHAGGPYLAIMMRDYPLSTDSASVLSSALNSPALSSPTIFRNGFSNGATAADTKPSESPAATEGRNSLTAHRRHLFKPLEEGLHTLVAGKVATTTTTETDHQRENGEISNEGRQQPSGPSGDPEMWRMSEARTRLRRQIDALPRFGALLTLDVKGNDLRVSCARLCVSSSSCD
jgi:protein phosphatase 1 regulatory subunit 37